MKKIFYSMMAVALCACSQSDVDDVVTAPQPENKGLSFEVVDNGFQYDDGTRVAYGAYGTDGAYTATFEDGDEIGIYAIDPQQINTSNGVPNDAAYNTVVRNVKLTLANGKWTSAEPLNLPSGTLLFAYTPYIATDRTTDPNAYNDGDPSFTKNSTTNEWEVNTGNNRFFVGHPLYGNVDNGSKDAFEKADMMGATYTLKGTENEKVTFKMIHMRGMIELTTPTDVTLTDLTLKIGNTPYSYNYYIYNEGQADRTKNVYRILTTEYIGQNNTLCATIRDGNIEKQYQKKLTKMAEMAKAGYCSKVNINYIPDGPINVSETQKLAATLTTNYGTDYASNATLTTLILTGKLATEDWETLKSLQHLTSLDMSALTNESIPAEWLKDAPLKAVLANLTLPEGLKSIGNNALQVGGSAPLTNIELPINVETIGDYAFGQCYGLSIRIPATSKLKTVGQYAFEGAKAVYTDTDNINVLKIPTSVTSISAKAFANMNQLRKVIFEASTAPEIDATAFDQMPKAMIFVPNDSYKGKFPGKTVLVSTSKISLTTSNYSSPFTHDSETLGWTDGIGLVALCDGITGTDGNYWHNHYMNETITYNEWGVYIDITLPQSANNICVSYTTRNENANGAPAIVRLAVSNDGENYTAVGEDYTGEALATDKNQTMSLGPIAAAADYNHVRFAVLKAGTTDLANQTISQYGGAVNLSELSLYAEGWTDPANTPAQ